MPSLPERLKPILAQPVLPAVLVWLALCALFATRAWDSNFLALFGDTDDATRLVVVRDLMGGQNWFDHVQYRFNTPYGAEIHWSRLIDAPLWALIALGNLFAFGQGERVALFVWPLFWLLPALWLTAKLTDRLLGPGNILAALFLAALTVPVVSEFAPGRIDHHNVQMVLVLWLMLETLNAPRSNSAALKAGIAAATSLAIGAETLPVIVAAIMAFGLFWVRDKGFAPRLGRFGASLAGAMLIHFLVAVGPADWLAAHCDALSLVYVVAAFGIAAVFFGLGALPLPEEARLPRLGFGLAGGALIGVVLFELFPSCAAGPYAALDPFLRHAWLANIVEARPYLTSLASLPAYTLAVSLPLFLALGAGIHRLVTTRAAARGDWLGYVLLLAFAIVGMMLQLRGVRLAALMAVPGGVALVAMLRARYLARQGPSKIGAAFALVAGWVGMAGVVLFMLASLVFPAGSNDAGASPLAACLSEPAFEPLARLSPARIAAPVDLGPYIVLMTPHATIGSPYHRNTEGIGDSLRVFGADEEAAWRVIARRGIDLVVMCDDMLAVIGNGFGDANSLKALFEAGGQPDWLTPVAVPAGALKVYRVAR
ncbi:MAG: hypothetical protein KKH72_09005 [Alphaproteobacteria bacterium]|nr:hypothetical protein [Alphaproteobacteria bacterium]